MPLAATQQAVRPTPIRVAPGAEAHGHALMATLPATARSGALEAWICALLMALLGNIEPLRQFFPHVAACDLPEDDEAALRLIRHAIRAENRLRARIAWRLRQHPNRGMRRTFGRRASERPLRPPRASEIPPTHPASVMRPPPRAAPTHARSPAGQASAPGISARGAAVATAARG